MGQFQQLGEVITEWEQVRIMSACRAGVNKDLKKTEGTLTTDRKYFKIETDKTMWLRKVHHEHKHLHKKIYIKNLKFPKQLFPLCPLIHQSCFPYKTPKSLYILHLEEYFHVSLFSQHKICFCVNGKCKRNRKYLF